MHAHKNPVKNVVGSDDVEVDLYPFLLGYKDGRVERLLRSRFVAASENPAANRGVATRDVVIDPGTGVSARLFLPTRAAAMAGAGGRRLPLVVYIHGGSFCTESAFCRTYHGYATSLAAAAGAFVVSLDYRLAPEHPIPAAYDDAWSALRWAAASIADDPWLAGHADPRRTFLAGDSAGGNIAYHTAVRASRRGVDVDGVIVMQPYFWGTERLPSEAASGNGGAAVLPATRVDRLWPFVTAGRAGNDDPRLNPTDEDISSLTCRRVLVAVAGKDTLRERGVRLFGRIRDYYAVAGGEATLVVSEGEDHGFHLYSPLRDTSRKLMESIVRFINDQPAPPPPEVNGGGLDYWHGWEGKKKINRTSTVTTPELVILGVPSRPFRDIVGYGMDMKRQRSGSTTCCMMAYGRSKIGGPREQAAAFNKAKYGLSMGPMRPYKAYKGPSATTLLGGTPQVIKKYF